MAADPQSYIFGPGSAGLFSSYANEPTSQEALAHRRKIAEVLAARKTAAPKNFGEGLTYLGESLYEADQNRRLRAAESGREAGLATTTADLERGGPATAAPAPAAAVGPRASLDPAVSETVAAADGAPAPAAAPTTLAYADPAASIPPPAARPSPARPAPIGGPLPAAPQLTPMVTDAPPPGATIKGAPDAPSVLPVGGNPFFDPSPATAGPAAPVPADLQRYAPPPPDVAGRDVAAAPAGGPTFRTERNAEVGNRVGFDRAVSGIHPELGARLQAAYNDMPEDVRQSFVLNEGFRTPEYQQHLFDTRSGRGLVARPGNSRHESGAAVDVDRGPALDWLQKNGRQYGLSGIKGDYPHIQMTSGGRQFYDPANPVALASPGGTNVAVANGGYNAIDAAAGPVRVADTPREAVTNSVAALQEPTDAAQVARTRDVLGGGAQGAPMPRTAALDRSGVVSDAPPLGASPPPAGIEQSIGQRNAIAESLLNQRAPAPPEVPQVDPTQAPPTGGATPVRVAQAGGPPPASVLGPQGASAPLPATAGAVRAAPPQAIPSMQLPPKLGDAPPTFDEPRPTKPPAPTRTQPGPIEANALRVYRSTDDKEIQRRAAAVASQYQKVRDDAYARDIEAYKEDMKHYSASDSAWVKRKDEALQHYLDRQHKANEITKQYEDQAGRLPAAAAPSPYATAGAYDTRLGTETSPQRSGVPSIPPVPPGIAPDKWREAHTTKAIADTEAVEKAAPDFAENLRLLKLARAHPGKDSALGFFGKIARATPGTDAAGFQAITDQIAGKNFLAAYQQLRGSGAISEVEGKKAEESQARLSLAQNKEDYDRALLDFENSLRRGLEKAQRKVNMPVTAWRKESDNESYAPDVGERDSTFKDGKTREYIGGNPTDISNSWKIVR